MFHVEQEPELFHVEQDRPWIGQERSNSKNECVPPARVLPGPALGQLFFLLLFMKRGCSAWNDGTEDEITAKKLEGGPIDRSFRESMSLSIIYTDDLHYPADSVNAPKLPWPGTRCSARSARHRYSSLERSARAYAEDH
jgi:hypothetical protein